MFNFYKELAKPFPKVVAPFCTPISNVLGFWLLREGIFDPGETLAVLEIGAGGLSREEQEGRK